MDTKNNEFDARIKKLTKATDARLDQFDKSLKLLEADTVWKIKDFEKLLETRPTLQYVKSAMSDATRDVLIKARCYTDDELNKMKESDNSIGNLFNTFQIQTTATLKDFEQKLAQ